MTTHTADHSNQQTDWRCRRCDRLLGVRHGDRVHIQFKRGAEYLVSLPVTATCCGCGALNPIG